MAESEEELKNLLMKVKVESESWLKVQHSENEDHGIRSHYFMGNRWGVVRNGREAYLGAWLKTEIQVIHASCVCLLASP